MARRLVVAGATVWFFRWLAAPIDADDEAELRPLPAARDAWEFPEPRRPADGRTLRRRFATSLAFTALFFAGGALAAGAGNVTIAEDPPVAAATDTATTTETTTSDATTTDATTIETTPTDATAVDATTTTATTPPATPDAAAAGEAPTTTEAPADVAAPTTTATEPVDTTVAVTAEPSDTSDPSAAAVPADTSTAPDTQDVILKATVPATSYASSPQPARHTKRRATRHLSTPVKHAPTRRVQNLPLAIPYHAIVFNPQAWLHDNPGTPTGQAAVDLALNYLGVPYRWGGAVPTTGFDCSGLTRFVYAQLGVGLTHYAAAQFASFPKLDPAQLAPGDLVFFEPKSDGPGHVGIYIGRDEMIEAPHTGAVVRISSFSVAAASLGFLGAVRPYAAPAPALQLASTFEWSAAARPPGPPVPR